MNILDIQKLKDLRAKADGSANIKITKEGLASDKLESTMSLGDAEYFMYLSDSFDDIAKEIEAGRALAEAWNNAGPAPHIHNEAKEKLSREWPTLYKALDAYNQAMN